MRCYFSQDAVQLETTAVDNHFIMEHLPRADGNQLRVYLYGLMLCRYPALDTDMAEALSLNAQEVLEAYAFWQREGLVYIRSAEPLLVEYASPGARMAQPILVPGKYHSLVQTIQALLAPRTLSAGELRRVYDWIEVYRLEELAVIELVSYCLSRKKENVSIRYMDAVARGWADAGARTAEDAKEQIALYEARTGGAADILKRWNKSRLPTQDEIAMYEKWTKEWGFTPEAVQAACPAAANAEKPTFKYLEGVLTRMRGENTITEADITALVLRESADSARARQVFAHMGARRAASTAQINALRDWIDAGMEMDVLLYAAEQSSEKERPYAYFKRLMEGYMANNIKTLAKAKEAEPPKNTNTDKRVPDYLNYSQRPFSEESIQHYFIPLDE